MVQPQHVAPETSEVTPIETTGSEVMPVDKTGSDIITSETEEVSFEIVTAESTEFTPREITTETDAILPEETEVPLKAAVAEVSQVVTAETEQQIEGEDVDIVRQEVVPEEELLMPKEELPVMETAPEEIITEGKDNWTYFDWFWWSKVKGQGHNRQKRKWPCEQNKDQTSQCILINLGTNVALEQVNHIYFGSRISKVKVLKTI